MSSVKLNRLDMTTGPFFPKVFLFLLPMILSNLFAFGMGMTQTIIIGKFSGSNCMAATSAAAPINAIMVSGPFALSVGTSILLARYIGSRQEEEVSDVVHSSLVFALLLGCLSMMASLLLAKPILRTMDTPEDILDASLAFLRVYAFGSPGLFLYNYLITILQAYGDTKRATRFSVDNSIQQLILVTVFTAVLHMGALGVGLGMMIPQVVSTVLLLRFLTRVEGSCRVEFKKLRMTPSTIWQMLKIGLPSTFETMLVGFGGTSVQAGINSLSTAVVAGSAAAGSVSSLISTISGSCPTVAQIAVSQNFGAGKFKNGWKLLGVTTVFCMSGLLLGIAFYFSSDWLLRLFVDASDPGIDTILATGREYLLIIGCTVFICNTAESFCAALRALGRSWLATACSLAINCGAKLLWMKLVFPRFQTIRSIYFLYPVNYVLYLIAGVTAVALTIRHLRRRTVTNE